MAIEYPKAIYNNESRVTVTVGSKEQEDTLKGFFKDDYQGGEPKPYKEINILEAIEIHSKAKKEVEKPSEKVDIKDMQWSKLKKYAKELGVKLPLSAKRDQIEELIQEVLNGNDKRLNQG